jgi:hypothetical protein
MLLWSTSKLGAVCEHATALDKAAAMRFPLILSTARNMYLLWKKLLCVKKRQFSVQVCIVYLLYDQHCLRLRSAPFGPASILQAPARHSYIVQSVYLCGIVS